MRRRHWWYHDICISHKACMILPTNMNSFVQKWILLDLIKVLGWESYIQVIDSFLLQRESKVLCQVLTIRDVKTQQEGEPVRERLQFISNYYSQLTPVLVSLALVLTCSSFYSNLNNDGIKTARAGAGAGKLKKWNVFDNLSVSGLFREKYIILSAIREWGELCRANHDTGQFWAPGSQTPDISMS